jgi:hypothetical protein
MLRIGDGNENLAKAQQSTVSFRAMPQGVDERTGFGCGLHSWRSGEEATITGRLVTRQFLHYTRAATLCLPTMQGAFVESILICVHAQSHFKSSC